jgi:hypothetical protein
MQLLLLLLASILPCLPLSWHQTLEAPRLRSQEGADIKESTGRSLLLSMAWPGLNETGVLVEELQHADPYHELRKSQERDARLKRTAGMLIQHHRLHEHYLWAVMACDTRGSWAATLSSTLISAFANGVRPLMTTIVWCRSYNKTEEASLLRNLRFSDSVNVLYMPKDFGKSFSDMPDKDKRIRYNYLMSLNLPELYGLPQVSLLVTEDDVLFAPDFSQSLRSVMAEIKGEEGSSEAYILSLYSGGHINPVSEAIKEYKALPEQRPYSHSSVHKRDGGWSWGAQGLLFSPAAVPGLRSWFYESLTGRQSVIGLQDMVILEFVKNYPRVKTYTSVPSLVQHVGARSAIFGDSNTRFHYAPDFPYEVAWMVDDPGRSWCPTPSE